MTQAELQSRFDELARQSRRMQIIGVPWIVLMMVFWGLRLRQMGKHPGYQKLEMADFLLLAASIVSIVVFIMYARRLFDQFAPRCPNCRKILTFNERKIIFEKNQCPFCKCRIIDRV
jgi:hypothetical protein